MGLPGPVASLLEQRQGALEVAGGQLAAALPPVDASKPVQRGRFGGPVTSLVSGRAGVLVDGDGLGVVAAAVEVPEQCGGQPDGMRGPAASGGVHRDRRQGGQFGIEPGARRDGIGDWRRGGGRCGHAWPAVMFAGEQHIHRCPGGVQVVVEQAGQRAPDQTDTSPQIRVDLEPALRAAVQREHRCWPSDSLRCKPFCTRRIWSSDTPASSLSAWTQASCDVSARSCATGCRRPVLGPACQPAREACRSSRPPRLAAHPRSDTHRRLWRAVGVLGAEITRRASRPG